MLYSFFCVIHRSLYFICRRFGLLCPIFIIGVSRKFNRDKIVVLFIQEKLWIEISLNQSSEEKKGACPSGERGCGG